MTKKRIITDTNIWYRISNEEIRNISKDYQLVVPIILLNEIYTSPNITISENTFKDQKKAVNAIIENLIYIEFIEYYPFHFLLKNSHYELKQQQYSKFYIEEFRAISKLKYENVQNISTKRVDISVLTKNINETSYVYKQLINKNLETKTKFKKFNTLEFTESLILKYANDILEVENTNFPKIIKLSSENEIFLKTFDKLLREVSANTTKKVEDNDWVDIFNLIYVGNNDLYWTKEKSKKKLVIESGLENYLFEK